MRLPDHPSRVELHNELHARPSIYFDGDADIWHVVVYQPSHSATIAEILPNLEDVVSRAGGSHGIGRLSKAKIKWEVHSEFLTLTLLFKAGGNTKAHAAEAFEDIFKRVGGQVVSADHVVVKQVGKSDSPKKPQLNFVASSVGGGDAEIYSDFQLSEDGFVEFHFFNRNLNAYRAGRMVRRILEIETYRMMAMLSVPDVRATVSNLASFDNRLKALLDQMQSTSRVDKVLLSEVTRLSSELLEFSAKVRNRFGATRAYAEIVASRISELREERVNGHQRIGTFIDRRFQPVVRSVAAAERRLRELAERVDLASDLLRTTVQVQLEEQNATLLKSLEERARVQVQIQQAVEGFSVIGITYYAISLAKVFLESSTEFGVSAGASNMMLMIALPVVLFTVWKGVRHVKRSIR